jgi:cell division septum initiation protein DivIVA
MSSSSIVEAIKKRDNLLKSFQRNYSLFIDEMENKTKHDNKIVNMYKELESMNNKKKEYDNIISHEQEAIESERYKDVEKARFEGKLNEARLKKGYENELKDHNKKSKQQQFNLLVIIVLIIGLLLYSNQESIMKMFK